MNRPKLKTPEGYKHRGAIKPQAFRFADASSSAHEDFHSFLWWSPEIGAPRGRRALTSLSSEVLGSFQPTRSCSRARIHAALGKG